LVKALLVSLSWGVTLNEIERLLVHGLVVAHHVLRERLDVLVAGPGQGQFGGGNVDHACGVGDMRDLRIGEFCALRCRSAVQEHHCGNRRAQSDKHV
jgi:hypothetical protein